MTPPSPSIDLNSLILFLGASQALLFVILLVFKRQRMRVINLHLAIMLLTIGSEVFHEFLLQTNYIYQVPALVGFALPLDALVGISVYWYVRLITHPERNHSLKLVLAHYSIFFACVLLSVPFWLSGFEDKLAMMQTGVIPDDWPALPYYATLLQTPIKIVSFMVYLGLAIHLLLNHRNRIRNIFSYRERITLNWLSLLLALFVIGLINGLGVLLFFQEYSESTQVMGFMGVFSLVAIFFIGIMGLMQPVIYRRREVTYLEENQEEVEQEAHGKYKHSSLTQDDMARIAAKIESTLKEKQLHLDANLTMPNLAAAIGVSPNYLSQTLNSLHQMSFFDYINRWRIEHAKALLTNPKQQHLSVVDIAAEAAFNSRSTFYTAFKQNLGVTPAQYRKSALQSA